MEAVGDTNAEHQQELTDILLAADTLLNAYIGNSLVPEVVRDLCTMKVAVHLFEQSNSNANNTAAFYETNEAPSFISRDPLNSVYKILNRWVSPW